MAKIGVLAPFKAKVNGEEILVDHATFTMRERRASRLALLGLMDDGLGNDEADTMAALLWVVLHRNDDTITFDEVYDSLDLGVLAEAEQNADTSADDADPEA